MKKIDSVLFDFDGVFWNSEFIWVEALLHILVKFGKNITSFEAYDLFAGTSHQTKKNIILEKYEIDIDDPEIKKIKKEKESELQLEVRLTENMKEVFEYLYNNEINMSIVTGAPNWAVLEKVKKWGLEKYFSENNLITAKEIEAIGGKGKPEPDIYLYAAQKNGVSPCECIVIEDSKQGIQSGISAKMTVIAFFEHQNDKQEITCWAKEKGISNIAIDTIGLLRELKTLI